MTKRDFQLIVDVICQVTQGGQRFDFPSVSREQLAIAFANHLEDGRNRFNVERFLTAFGDERLLDWLSDEGELLPLRKERHNGDPERNTR